MSRHRESAPVHDVGEGPRSPMADRAVVLVVDDDAAVRDALHLTLDREYAVMDAPHGRAALSMVRSERVDLILLDILMPEIDGLEILQELKALEPDLPVIMMTAVKTVRTTVAAMKLGASDYLTKPFQEEELLATNHRALEQRTGQTRAPGESWPAAPLPRSEEHTSELQSRSDIACRRLLEKKNKKRSVCDLWR